MANGLSNPQVSVNDEAVSIFPNSLVFKTSEGDKNVRALGAGGNSVEVVTTEDATTKKSMVKFKISNTINHLNLKRTWGTNSSNTIEFTENGQNYSFIGMVRTVEPEVPVSADSEIEVEFEGPPNIQ
jgi:hypothetical protein